MSENFQLVLRFLFIHFQYGLLAVTCDCTEDITGSKDELSIA